MDTVMMLDVDGVLNPWRMRNPRKTGLEGYHKETIDTIRVWVTEEHGKKLKALNVQIVWATTWVAFPDNLCAASMFYGLPQDLPVIDYRPVDDFDYKNSGKLEGVKLWLSDNGMKNSRLVWVDDDLGDDDRLWAESRASDSLLLQPIPELGLTADMYSQIASFVS